MPCVALRVANLQMLRRCGDCWGLDSRKAHTLKFVKLQQQGEKEAEIPHHLLYCLKEHHRRCYKQVQCLILGHA